MQDPHQRAIDHAATANFFEYMHNNRSWHHAEQHNAQGEENDQGKPQHVRTIVARIMPRQ